MKILDLFKSKQTDPLESTTWNTISEPEETQTLVEKSKKHPQLIYKHSNQCSVSFIAKKGLDSNIEKLSQFADLYIIDVIRQRDISNAIATLLKVRHESPQALLLKDGNVVWKGSHWDVDAEEILSRLNQNLLNNPD